MKKILPSIYLFCLLSCNDKLYSDQINRSKFCEYFTIEPSSYVINGKKHKTAFFEINKIKGDKVSDFIQKHHSRFVYIGNKTLSLVIKLGNHFDSSLNDKFCKALSSDTFYNHFVLLTSGDRLNKENKTLSFTTPELMKVASRFFYCDSIREKDTAIVSYHICVGINGIAELETTKDYTVLEAFCFEAIFKNIGRKSKLIANFNNHITQAEQENKKHFQGFKSYLSTIRNRCYVLMENDKDFEKVLLKYYYQNIDNINFKIE